MKIPKLTKKQWQQTVKLLNAESGKSPGPVLSEDSLEMARLHFVEGQSQPSVAEAYGVTKQAVSKTCARIYKFYMQNVEGFPADWQQAVITGPEDFIEEIKTLEQKLHNKLLKK